MLNPVFSINHMRHMTPIFYRISHKVYFSLFTVCFLLLIFLARQLRDAVSAEVKDGPRDVNILGWMGRTALELIGQGGLGYSFDPLTEDVPNEFGDALKAFLWV